MIHKENLSFPEPSSSPPPQTRVGRATSASDIGPSAIGPLRSQARSGTSSLGISWELVGNAGSSCTPSLLTHNLILKGPQVIHIHRPAWKAQTIWTLGNGGAHSPALTVLTAPWGCELVKDKQAIMKAGLCSLQKECMY